MRSEVTTFTQIQDAATYPPQFILRRSGSSPTLVWVVAYQWGRGEVVGGHSPQVLAGEGRAPAGESAAPPMFCVWPTCPPGRLWLSLKLFRPEILTVLLPQPVCHAANPPAEVPWGRRRGPAPSLDHPGGAQMQALAPRCHRPMVCCWIWGTKHMVALAPDTASCKEQGSGHLTPLLPVVPSFALPADACPIAAMRAINLR